MRSGRFLLFLIEKDHNSPQSVQAKMKITQSKSENVSAFSSEKSKPNHSCVPESSEESLLLIKKSVKVSHRSKNNQSA